MKLARTFGFPGAVVASLAAAACGRPAARHLTVRIEALRFVPDTLVVAPGDTVTWINADPVPHTVTAVAPTWDSGLLAADGRFSLVVDDTTAGHYRCRYHPEMQAVLRRR